MLASTAAVAVVASAVVPVASAASFKDLNNHMYTNEINALVEAQVITGYPDGTFRPNQTLTRSDVVKLLGKYLVSLGHEIPSDYKTKMRFTDLTPKSQDELLQYAALVKDVGVFNGDGGKLLHQNDLRRDQMASVLVRAFTVINDFAYVQHVKNQGFTSTLSDLHRTTHQDAITVLDYYDIVKGAAYNPKDATKRGEFAYFLYHVLNAEIPTKEPALTVMKVEVTAADKLSVTLSNNKTHTVTLPKPLVGNVETNVTFKIDEVEYSAKVKYVVTVKKIEVIAADKLSVTLSDDKAYTVTLPKPLVENIETDVTFKISDMEFSAKVKYEVPDLKVVAVTNPNAGQIKIDFNQPVALAAKLNEVEINKLIEVNGVDRLGKINLSQGELSADKKSLVVTIKGTTPLEGRYRVTVKDIKTDKGVALIKYDDFPSFVADRTGPAVATVENVGATRVKVKFTEPVNNTVGVTQFKLANGVLVSGVTGTIGQNATEVIYDLTNAYANGAQLTPGTMVTITFGTLVDLANNVAPANSLTTTVSVGHKDGILPTILNVEPLGAKKFKLIFSEEIRQLTIADIVVSQNSYAPGIATVVKDEKDPKAYIVTTNGYLNGYVTITSAPGRYITDLSGETNTFSTAFNFVADNSVPNYLSSAVVIDKGEEYLDITFDRNLADPTASSAIELRGSYVLPGGATLQIPSALSVVPIKHPTNDKVLRVKLSTLLASANIQGLDQQGATYFTTVTLRNIVSEYGQPVSYVPQIQFTRGGDLGNNQNKIAVRSVETTVYNPNLAIDNKTVLITFSHAVDGLTGFNAANYIVDGAVVESARVSSTNNHQVLLTLRDSTVTQQLATNITISNVKAMNSTVAMDPYRNVIHLNENIRPQNQGYIVVPHANEIVMTFTEPLINVLANSFTVKMNGANGVPDTPIVVTNVVQNGIGSYGQNQVHLTLAQPLTHGASFTIELANGATVSDAAKNLLLFTPRVFTYSAGQINY